MDEDSVVNSHSIKCSQENSFHVTPSWLVTSWFVTPVLCWKLETLCDVLSVPISQIVMRSHVALPRTLLSSPLSS